MNLDAFSSAQMDPFLNGAADFKIVRGDTQRKPKPFPPNHKSNF
ncbi:MAG: hypothetical protein RLZZ399_2773, partial [Verrucomicrobiota bacterium]